MTLTLIVLAVTVILFAVGRIRSDIVALSSLTVLMLFGILTPEEALSGFSSSVVIMMIGLFVVGGAILQTGIAKAASQRIMKLSKGNDTLMFLLVMVTTSFIGAFVSNTGTVALLMPIIVSMASESGKSPSRLLMPLAFASSIGGMLTLIGTPPNLVIQETLVSNGYEPLSFFSFFPVGIVCMVVGILVLLPLSRIFLDGKTDSSGSKKRKHKSLDKLITEYNLRDYLSVYRITERSSANGRTVAELDVRHRFGLSILEIRREQMRPGGILRKVKQKVASAKSVLKTGDILYLTGENENIKAFASKHSLEKLPSGDIDFYDIGIAEIVLMPGSSLVNSMLKDSSLREKYNLNVLGIRRSGDYIIKGLANEKLRIGDVLLVQGSWQNISQLDTYDDWVVMGQPSEQEGTVLLDYKAPLAALIMLLMICMMVFDFIPVSNVTAIMIAGLLMVLTGCLRNVDAAYKTIKWESVVLIAAMMPMSIALQKTGTSDLISSTLVEWLRSSGPVALLAGLYFTTSLMTMFISNTATAVLMAPIALSAATQIGVSPYPFLFAVTLGASMCFASPFSTPPNALVMKAGNYTFMDYVKVGLPLQLIMGIVMVFVLPYIFPF